jgi:hypothetical protein
MKAKFMCDKKQMTGEVVKSNFYTIWVKIQFKKKVRESIEGKIKDILKPYDAIIKRHKEKHAVVLIGV